MNVRLKNSLKLLIKNILPIIIVSISLFFLLFIGTKALEAYKHSIDLLENKADYNFYSFDVSVHGYNFNKKTFSEESEIEEAKNLLKKLSKVYNENSRTYFIKGHGQYDKGKSVGGFTNHYLINWSNERGIYTNNKKIVGTREKLFDKEYEIKYYKDSAYIEKYFKRVLLDDEGKFYLVRSEDILDICKKENIYSLMDYNLYVDYLIKSTQWKVNDTDKIKEFLKLTNNNLFFTKIINKNLNIKWENDYFKYYIFPTYFIFILSILILLLTLLNMIYEKLFNSLSLHILFGATKLDILLQIIPIIILIDILTLTLSKTVIIYETIISNKTIISVILGFSLISLAYIVNIIKPENLIKQIRNR